MWVCVNSLSSVFTTVATSINVKISNDDSDEGTVSRRCLPSRSIFTRHHQDTPQPSGSSTPLDRTSTGILSSRPQKAGLPALEAPVVPQSARPSLMVLAKRESARRGLYSKFFRGPVLGPDTEARELLIPGATKPTSPSRAGFNEPERSTSITEKKVKKRKFREEHGNTGVAQRKRDPKSESEAKNERKERRRLKRLRKEAEKSEIGEIPVEGDVETGLTKVSEEGSMQGGDCVGYSRKQDRKKKKRRGKDSVACHER
jgi:hypothetical protein